MEVPFSLLIVVSHPFADFEHTPTYKKTDGP